MKNKPCNWCDTVFDATVSYQVYCSSECRDAATKEKINQRYLANRRIKRQSKPRMCKSCGSQLSVYNDDVLCTSCTVNPKDVNKVLKDIRNMANGKDIKPEKE